MESRANRTIGVEQCWSPRDIARRWRLDISTVRRLFRYEPGVLRFQSAGGRTSLRVPQSVIDTIEKRIVVKHKYPTGQKEHKDSSQEQPEVM